MTAFLTNAWLGMALIFVGGLYLWHRQNKLEARLDRAERLIEQYRGRLWTDADEYTYQDMWGQLRPYGRDKRPPTQGYPDVTGY